MGTEDGPLPDLELVPDAALPEPEELAGDIVRGDVLPTPRPVPTPADVEAEERRAASTAAAHLEQLRRRAARRPARAAGAWAQRPLGAARYCVIDLETTGTGVWGQDEILEVGAVRVTGGELGPEFATLVRPRRPIGAGAQRVHGITPAMVDGAPPLAAVLPTFLEMLRDRVLVFHNAPFDLGFLQRALSCEGREALRNPVLDTLVVARALVGGACGLGNLGRRLGLPAPHLHRALADARLTAQLLLAQLACLTAAGAQVLGDVPGFVGRVPRARRVHGGADEALASALRQAAARGHEVQIVYRLGPGLLPQELAGLPLEVRGPGCLVRVRDGGEPVLLALERIEAVHRLR